MSEERKLLFVGLARSTTELVTSKPWSALSFLARLDRRQAEALPAALRDAYQKTLAEAANISCQQAVSGPQSPKVADEIVKAVDCEKIVIADFAIWEDTPAEIPAGEKASPVLEYKSASIHDVRLRKKTDKNKNVTIWLRFAVEAEGCEAGAWGARNVGKWFRVSLNG